MIEVESDRPIGYLELLHINRNYRNLWFGQVVSELGDWLATVALLNIMLDLTGRAMVVGWFFIIVYIPSAVIGPLSGMLADRFDRKKIMIAMDLTRAILVLGYLLVHRADQIWLIYLIATVEVAMMTVFEPARNAIIPDICSRRQLVAANALGSITWSCILVLGAAVGGIITAVFGRQVCYVADSLSFIGSAFFLARVRSHAKPPSQAHRSIAAGFRDIYQGFQYMRSCPRVMVLVLVKAGWYCGGGVILLLSVFGKQVFPVMGSGAAGIGVLYAARGIGAALGPVAARRMLGESAGAMRHAITAGFLVSSACYIVFGQSRLVVIAALAVALAHAGSSMTWVFSTVLLQLEVPSEFRGRIFATEFVLVTLGFALSNYVSGYWLDALHLTPRTVATLLGIYFSIPAVLWIAARRLYP
jgi:MFS family permease